MKETFDKALSFTLSWEGGYSNDPRDPGGETNFGISKRAYPDEDIKGMTKERASMLYRRDYWNACKCDDLPFPLDIVVFDTAVNMGVGRAQTFIEWSKDWRDYLMLRIKRYNDIARKNPTFLRGWLNRTLSLWEAIKREA